MFGSASKQNGNGLGFRAAGDERHVGVADLFLLHSGCLTEVIAVHVFEIGDDGSSGRFGQGFHVGFLCSTNRKNSFLGEVVLSQFVNAFLTDEDVGACVFDGVDEVTNVVLFFFEEQGELVGVGDLNLGVHFGLFDFNSGVDQRNFCIAHTSRHTGMNSLLVQQNAVDERGIFDGTALALFDLDIGEVNQAFIVFDNANGVYCSHTNVGHEGLDSTSRFSGEGGLGDLLKHVVVVLG